MLDRGHGWRPPPPDARSPRRERRRHSVQADRVRGWSGCRRPPRRGLQRRACPGWRRRPRPGPSWRVNTATELLPLVPVTATTVARLPAEAGQRPGPGLRGLLGHQGGSRWRQLRASPSTATAPSARASAEIARRPVQARHRREQVARPDRARVEAQAADLDLAAASQAEAVIAQRCQAQGSPPAG